jgi:hypothetical protein
MNRQLIVCGALAAALATASCSNMNQSQQSTLSGAAIGTADDQLTGEWAWAAAGAAIGAGAGYLTEQERQRQAAAQQKAYEAGVQSGKAQAQQKN